MGIDFSEMIENEDNLRSRLTDILSQMDVPPDRFNDLNWLRRNMGIRNRTHAGFLEANEIIRKLSTVQ